MSAWMWIPYLNYQVELGTISREQADERLRQIIEADRKQDELDYKINAQIRLGDDYYEL